jgi:hypothetical protein
MERAKHRERSLSMTDSLKMVEWRVKGRSKIQLLGASMKDPFIEAPHTDMVSVHGSKGGDTKESGSAISAKGKGGYHKKKRKMAKCMKGNGRRINGMARAN